VNIWGNLALCLTLGACTTGGPAAVRIERFAFRPSAVHATSGNPVTFTNRDGAAHTATSGVPEVQGVPGVTDTVPARPDGRFDLALPARDASASVTLDETGTYPYFCSIHAGMSGTIVIG
jgi:plastocyanin